jgi:DNA polymerase-3 subunit beta
MSTATVGVENVNPVVVDNAVAAQKKEKPAPRLKFIVGRGALLKAVEAALPTVEKKTTIPLLSCFLLDVSASKLTLQATDLDISQTLSVPVITQRAGKLCVSATALRDAIKNLPEGDLSFEALDNYWLKVTAGAKTNKLVGMNPSNFPCLPKPPQFSELQSFPVAAIRTMLDKVLPFVSKEESRYTLNAVLFERLPRSFRIVATDGHRLITTEQEAPETGAAFSVLWSTLIARRILALSKKETGTLDYALVTDQHAIGDTVTKTQTLHFRVGESWLTSRPVTGQFPTYSAVMPRKAECKSLTINAEKLAASVKWTALCADERSKALKVTFAADTLTLAAFCTDKGEAEEKLPALSDITIPFTTGFNAGYILDCLKAIDTENVTFKVRDANVAVLIVPSEQSGVSVHTVVMPMRI